MSQILVRNLEPDVVERLKGRASRHGRSLQSEVRMILTQSAKLSFPEAREAVLNWQTRLAGRDFPDSVEMLRESRDR